MWTCRVWAHRTTELQKRMCSLWNWKPVWSFISGVLCESRLSVPTALECFLCFLTTCQPSFTSSECIVHRWRHQPIETRGGAPGSAFSTIPFWLASDLSSLPPHEKRPQWSLWGWLLGIDADNYRQALVTTDGCSANIYVYFPHI